MAERAFGFKTPPSPPETPHMGSRAGLQTLGAFSERKRCPFFTLFRFGGLREALGAVSERNKVSISHVIWLRGSGGGRPWERLVREIRGPFLTLFGFGGSRGGPLGETPSPSRLTWLSETPSLGVGGGRRARTGESGRNRLELGWGPARGARNPAPRPPPNSPKIP